MTTIREQNWIFIAQRLQKYLAFNDMIYFYVCISIVNFYVLENRLIYVDNTRVLFGTIAVSFFIISFWVAQELVV